MKILIMGANGNQGRLMVPRFARAGFAVRAVTAHCADEVRANGATEVMVGEGTDRGFLREAVSGVDTVYHIGPTAYPLEREMGFAMVDVAREARVGHLIYSSVLHPIADLMPQHKLKREVEQHLLESNLPFTVLQPADYMMPITFQLAFESGYYEMLYGVDRGQAMVALTDVADVAVKVAREREKHFGATYQLCAPGNPSANDIAAACTRITGRSMEARYVTPDTYFQRYYGMGEGDQFRYQLALIRAVGLWYQQYDFAGNSNVLDWLLGRPPTTLEDFIANEWRIYQGKGGK